MADYTRETWAQTLLRMLGVPVTSGNVGAIVAWEQAEGGHWSNPDRYNPLNTTQSMPGARATNSVGVKAYTSWQQGLDATVKTLKNGRYGGILSALGRGTDASGVKAAIVSSPWGTKRIGDITPGSTGGAVPVGTGGSSGGAVVPVGWHIPGTPWDIPTPGDAIGGVEGAAAGITRAVTRIGIMAPVVLGGVVLIVLGAVRTTSAAKRKTTS